MTTTTQVSEKDFYAIYKPQHHPSDPEQYLLDFHDVQDIDLDLKTVWSVVESGEEDDENWYAIPGFHVVNVMGYALTEKPWETGEEEAVFFEGFIPEHTCSTQCDDCHTHHSCVQATRRLGDLLLCDDCFQVRRGQQS